MQVLRRVLPGSLMLAVFLACSAPVMAQDGIERQMTADEFKAAGLDKLSADELARLNAWLTRTIGTESAKAASSAKKKVVDENRGFFSFGTTDPIVSTIAGEFKGFGKGRQYTLANGQVWRQVDAATLDGVRASNPKVKIAPSVVGNAWYLAIDGYNSRAKVERLK